MFGRKLSLDQHIKEGRTVAVATTQRAHAELSELISKYPELKIINFSHKATEIHSHWRHAMSLPRKERNAELERWANTYRRYRGNAARTFDAAKLDYSKLLIVGSATRPEVSDSVALMFKKLHGKFLWQKRPPVVNIKELV